MPDVEILAFGSLHSADFDGKTVTLRIQGDMPPLRAGRYALVDAERLRMLGMQARLWRDTQRRKAATKDSTP
jgi:hypothetical protein